MKLDNRYEGNRQSNMRHSAKQSYNFCADITGQVSQAAAATHSVEDRHTKQKGGEKHMQMYIYICEKSGEGTY